MLMTGGCYRGLEVDGGIPLQLAWVPAGAAELERCGYDGCWTGEINHDPFLPMLLAAEHTSKIELGTSIAVAFARNPMTVVNLAWDLQYYSDGRFILGLGTQVQAHMRSGSACPGRERADVASCFSTKSTKRQGSSTRNALNRLSASWSAECLT